MDEKEYDSISAGAEPESLAELAVEHWVAYGD